MLTSGVIHLVGDLPLAVDLEKHEVISKRRGCALHSHGHLVELCMTHHSDAMDASHGYEERAEEFRAGRSPVIGVATVRKWASSLPTGAAVLDLGCGDGVPIMQVLVDAGFEMYGVDASPRMIAALRARFPAVQA